MELTEFDLKIALQAFPQVEALASIEEVGVVEVRLNLGDQVLVLGYGESGNPAILQVLE